MAEGKKTEKITKRIAMSQDTYKYLKKMSIDLEIDNDGKFTPEVLGICIDEMINRLENKQD
jgi:hypothetical protein